MSESTPTNVSISANQSSRLVNRIKETVKAIEPNATVILFGSRARQSAMRDSDWDVLVLVDGPVTAARKRALRHSLYELEWDAGEVISSIIKSREEWATPRLVASPFFQNVTREGIIL